ncbi:MAG TPA: 2-phospho-L-lactate guanylyltransferase [Solirubrobacteraceae bacterium]|nr:2-phospho-L-lactate guanylyltransferase [Solirubrobacteraceae bacterium]
MVTAAVLPIKTYARAKHRLSAAVEVPDRRALAEAMVGDVLDALPLVPGLARVIAVTAEPRAAAAAREAGADVVDDPDEAGQSAAALIGIAAALRLGAERVLLVPGDCPALDPAEVGAMLERQGRAGVVIVPDRHGAGTNALLLSPPDVIEPSFGPGSFARHAARAHAAGTVVRVAEVRSLGLDVDTPEDLQALREALEARPGAAPRTRALLARMLPAAAAAG